MLATPTSHLFEVKPNPNARWLSAADKMKLTSNFTQSLKPNNITAWRGRVGELGSTSATQLASSLHSSKRWRNEKALLVPSYRFAALPGRSDGRRSRPNPLSRERALLLMHACQRHPESSKRLRILASDVNSRSCSVPFAYIVPGCEASVHHNEAEH